MALPNSGQLSLDDIQTEFGGTNPIGLSEYYGVADGIPASGTIDVSDFYGASAGATSTLTPANDGANATSDRMGFGASGKTDFYYPESVGTAYRTAFGSMTNTSSLITGATIQNFCAEEYGGYPSTSINPGYLFNLGVSGLSTSSGFTSVSFQSYLPSASSTVTRTLTRSTAAFGAMSRLNSETGLSQYAFTWHHGTFFSSTYSNSAVADIFHMIEYAVDNSQTVAITFA